MDISARAWLIVIGVLLIAAVLLDGYRRMRKNNRIDFGKMKGFEKDDFTTELPNGGARVTPRDEFDQDYEGNFDANDELDKQFEGDNTVADYNDDLPAEKINRAIKSTAAKAKQAQQKPKQAEVQELYIVNVIASNGESFAPELLLQVLLDVGLRFGEMDIFHKYSSGAKPIANFSVANALEPGFFNVDDMSQYLTQGLTFFMALPGPKSPLASYDMMIECASTVAKKLNADLKDSEHNILTSQIMMHDRQNIEEYIRRSFRVNIE